ncbi:MAG TPA: hypothetical protein DEQ20_02365 [Desulfobulbaceae bacterium]|nr:MAG: hypothetical protein A2520_03670 [Deltaproteobacteria bacterium RIFOXYD12_FULL_53_23]HCC53758.1 hypothetical protein [Desulfobulbaceae bacterium]
MKKKLTLTLATVFWAVQLLALLHMAECGFGKHEHDGQTCGIYLSTEQSKYCAIEKPVSVSRLEFAQGFVVFPTQTCTSCQTFIPSSPRAPPAFLLS